VVVVVVGNHAGETTFYRLPASSSLLRVSLTHTRECWNSESEHREVLVAPCSSTGTAARVVLDLLLASGIPFLLREVESTTVLQ
jgi:hypothetical protein